MLFHLPQPPPIIIHRYRKVRAVTTNLDPLQDLLVHLEFLTSTEYLVDLLESVHNVSKKEAPKRASRIVPHVRAANAYISQANSGPAEVSFLPCYYAILNLLKVYILLSSRHQQLASNRWHGASYDGYAKTSQSLVTEEITLRAGGSIPLFYEVVTGRKVKDKTRVRMGDLYPLLVNVGAEWQLATDRPAAVLPIVFALSNSPTDRLVNATVYPQSAPSTITLGRLPVLRDFKADASGANKFIAKHVPIANETDEDAIRQHLDCTLMYYPIENVSLIPVCTRSLLMPEELPIALAFFHLSSVARYKPEFLARLRDSRYWPVVSALRHHGLYKFLLLFWSYVRQETILMKTN
jgi:hypothetical protein